MQWVAVIIASVGVLFCALGRAAAQPTNELRETSQLAGQVDIARLVDLAATRNGVNVEYDGAGVTGKVTLRLVDAVSDEELWALMNRVLLSRGLTTVRTAPRSMSVVKLAEAAGLARLDEDAPGERKPGFRAASVRVAHRSAKDIAEAVGRLLSKPGGVVSVMGDDTLIVADLAFRVDQALELVARLDVRASEGGVVVREVPAVHVTPARLVAVVMEINAKRGAVVSGGAQTGMASGLPGEVMPSPSGGGLLLICPVASVDEWLGLIASMDRPEAEVTRSYRGGRELAAAVERSGGVVEVGDGVVVVTATPSRQSEIAAIVEAMEATGSRSMRTFSVRNRNATELGDVIRGLVEDSQGPNGGSSDRQRESSQTSVRAFEPGRGEAPDQRINEAARAAARAGQSGTDRADIADPKSVARGTLQAPDAQTGEAAAADQWHDAVSITADDITNTLIAMGEPGALDRIAVLVEQLDVRQSQVMLEVMLVSLSDSQTLDLGVELEKLELGPGTRWRLASLFGLSSRGPDGVPRTGNGTGFTGVVLDPGDFSVVVRALQTLNNGRSMSMPRVLVANNQRAVLDSVLQQPFASTNASDTVATTSFGGTQDAGTTVTVRPQIAEGDHLLLEYSLSLSAFVGSSADPRLPPPRQQNRVQSSAMVPDGFTVVVGGIEVATDARGTSQIPLLGDVPLLGEAFKSRSKDRARSRFYVFIRANVLRSTTFADLRYLSEADAGAAGLPDGLPVLSPRVIR